LVHARKSLGLNQSLFADRIGVPLPTLRAWEAGLYSPPDRRRNEIEEVLGAFTCVRIHKNSSQEKDR
jgi:transcriptional regulator with XRE-family HTH domain